MTHIETNRDKNRIRKLIALLREENPNFDKELANAWNSPILNDRKSWAKAMLRVIYTSIKVGERGNPISES